MAQPIAVAVAAACGRSPDSPSLLLQAYNVVYARVAACRKAAEIQAARAELFAVLAQAYDAHLRAAPLQPLHAAWLSHTDVVYIMHQRVFVFANGAWPREKGDRQTSRRVMDRVFIDTVLHSDAKLDEIADSFFNGRVPDDVLRVAGICEALECADETVQKLTSRLARLPVGDGWIAAACETLSRFDEASARCPMYAAAFAIFRAALLDAHLSSLLADFGRLVASGVVCNELGDVARLVTCARVDVDLLVPALDAAVPAEPEAAFDALQWLAYMHDALMQKRADLRPRIVSIVAARLSGADADETAAAAAKLVVARMRAGDVDDRVFRPKHLYLHGLGILIDALLSKDVFVRTFHIKISIELVRAFGKPGSAFEQLRGQLAAVLPVIVCHTQTQTNLERILQDATLARLDAGCRLLVATSLSWKLPAPEPFDLTRCPRLAPFKAFVADAEIKYAEAHSGRKLTWHHLLATAHARLDGKNLILSLPQLVLLDAVIGRSDVKRVCADTSVDTIALQSGIDAAHLSKAAQTLCAHRVLEESAGGCLRLGDTSSMPAKPLNLAAAQPWTARKPDTDRFVHEERSFMLDAAIVRVLKSRKEVASDQELVALLAAGPSLHFQVSSAMVKTALAKLVGREYATVSPDGRITYIS